MAKKKPNKELEVALADQKWWKEQVGDPLGLKLVGWSYRHRASFIHVTGRYVQIEKWFADVLIESLAKTEEPELQPYPLNPITLNEPCVCIGGRRECGNPSKTWRKQFTTV